MLLTSTYFSFGGNLYEQKEGTAMDSPVSAVVAILYTDSVLRGAGTGDSIDQTQAVEEVC